MTKLQRFCLFSFTLLIFVCATTLATGRGRHNRMYAVPRPGPVSIDGKLEDWDMSGHLLSYVRKAASEVQSARFAVMYDEKAIYLGAEVRDPNPMMNRHDPKVEPGRGWDADSCQFRMVVDPEQGYPVNMGKGDKNDQLIHMTIWYFTDRKEPVLQLMHGFYQTFEPWPDGVVPHENYDAAYRKTDDGKGYVFEYRIPWSTLRAKNPPQGGDLVPATVQFNWSRPDGMKLAVGSSHVYDLMSGAGFPYKDSFCWGKLIFSKEGNVSRELVEKGLPVEKPLPLSFDYDLPEAGEVTIALYDENGEMVRQIITEHSRNAGQNVERWDGLDAVGTPLPAGEYTWKGLYHPGIETEFRLSVHNSGNPSYKTADNTGGWGADHGEPRTVVATGDRMLLSWDVCESGWGIIRTNLSGQKQWGIKHNAVYMAAADGRFYAAGGGGFTEEPGVRIYDLKNGRRLNYGTGRPSLLLPAGDENPPEVTGLAVHDGRLFVSYAARNIIGVYSVPGGRLRDRWEVKNPRRLAVTPEGKLLAISDARIVGVSGEEVETVAEKHLAAPAGIATDTEGRIYVANRGRRQNVSIFSPLGTYLRSIGREGGRPRAGRWIPSGMLDPGGIDIDAEGRLWVAETRDAPKRISVWNTETGELVTDYFGGSHYSTYASMDPADIGRVYCHGVQWKVDVDRGTKRPEAVVAPDYATARMRVFTANNGRQYATARVQKGAVGLFIRKGHRFHLIAGVVHPNFFKDHAWYEDWQEELPRRTRHVLWSDDNGDMEPAAGEVVPSPLPVAYSGGWVDRDLSIYGTSRWHSVKAYRLRAAGIQDNGIPTYDPAEVQSYGPGRMDPVATNHIVGSAPEKAFYLLGGPMALDDGRFPTLSKFSFDGTRQWGYWRLHPRWSEILNMPIPEKGTVLGAVTLMGKAGDYIATQSYFGTVDIWTSDGLYVDRVFRDTRTGAVGADVIGCEFFCGEFTRTEKEGRYFVLAGDQDGRVNEVVGLDAVRGLGGGTYRISPEQVAKVKEAQDRYQRRRAQSQKLVLVRGRGSLAKTEGVTRKVGGNRRFTARVAYDEKNLYLSYDVTSPHGLVNSATDSQVIFTGGNCLDLQMATNPEAPADRTEPAPGDLRLVLTRRDEQPVAVLYEAKVAGFDGDPTVLESPVDRESFDRIRVVSNRIRLKYRERSGGFQATATIPLDLLGWQPEPGSRVKIDVGYIFGNESGTEAALRSYWANNSPEANVTDDIPDESRLNPEHWGTAVVE